MGEPAGSVRHPLWRLADEIQMDVRQLSAKLVELRAQLSAVDLPEAAPVFRCECGDTQRTQHDLEEHRYRHHDGPLPSLWALADERSGDA